MAGSTQAYIPGVCNINREEIAYRRKWRNIGLLVTVVLAAALILTVSNRWIRLALFLPAFVGFINYLQTKNHFCVSYAAAGLQNADEGSTRAVKVADPAHNLDQAKARKMNAQAVVAALMVTALALIV